MSPGRSDAPHVDRRTVLKGLGAGSALAAGGLAPGSVSGTPRGRFRVPAGQYEPDTSRLPEVDEAELRIHEDGSVSGHLRIDGDRLKRGRGTGAGRQVSTYSLGLDLEDRTPEHARALAKGRPADAGLHAAVGKEKRPGRSVEAHSHLDGISDEPSTGSHDVGVFGDTKSQECSTLARTTVLSDVYDYYGGTVYYNADDERETVDGDACTGHQWDAKFQAFCDYLGWIPGYDCGVPSLFNTTWNTDAANSDSLRAQSHFSCSNFPVVPDTVVTAHDIRMIESGSVPDIEFDYTVGVVDEYDFSDYGLDQNGIANLVTDGLSALYDVDSVYSYGVAVYLLDHSDGVVF